MATMGGLLQVTSVQPIDPYECLVMVSDGELELGVLVNRVMYRMDILECNIVAKFNIIDVTKTTGGISTKDLKLVKFKTPGEMQLPDPHLLGAPVPWVRPGTTAAYQPQGRFSAGGTEVSGAQAPLLLCGDSVPQVPGKTLQPQSDAEKIAAFLAAPARLPEVVGRRSLLFVPERMPATYLK